MLFIQVRISKKSVNSENSRLKEKQERERREEWGCSELMNDDNSMC